MPSDEERADNLQAIAAAIFARHGVDFAAVQRAGGWTNAVWLADGLVLRLAAGKEQAADDSPLLREARLAALFGPAVGYPPLVDAGTIAGYAWTLAARMPGRSLGEAWAGLGWDARITALHGLWARAEAVHAVPPAEAAAIVGRRAWFNNTDAGEAQAGLQRLAKQGILSAQECRVLQDALGRFWRAVPLAPCVLCHGDLTLDNAMWHAGEVVALLDFEFALLAPIQLDLNHLVKCAFGPPDPARFPSAHAGDGADQLRRSVQELAAPLIAQPANRSLLLGYAILLELWLLELWLAHPEGEGPLEQWEPLRRLVALAEGSGGYLAPLLHG